MITQREWTNAEMQRFNEAQLDYKREGEILFEIMERYNGGGGILSISAPSYGEAVLKVFARGKKYDHYPIHSHIDAIGNITFRGKTIGQIS